MKYCKPLLPVLVILLLFQYNLFGQNPNWTLPPGKLEPQTNGYNPLPTQPGSPYYHGDISTCLHGAYSDPHGDVLTYTHSGLLSVKVLNLYRAIRLS